MNTKFFEIDNRLNKKEISEDEAEKLKKSVQKEVDSKSKLTGATKFFIGMRKGKYSSSASVFSDWSSAWNICKQFEFP